MINSDNKNSHFAGFWRLEKRIRYFTAAHFPVIVYGEYAFLVTWRMRNQITGLGPYVKLIFFNTLLGRSCFKHRSRLDHTMSHMHARVRLGYLGMTSQQVATRHTGSWPVGYAPCRVLAGDRFCAGLVRLNAPIVEPPQHRAEHTGVAGSQTWRLSVNIWQRGTPP